MWKEIECLYRKCENRNQIYIVIVGFFSQDPKIAESRKFEERIVVKEVLYFLLENQNLLLLSNILLPIDSQNRNNCFLSNQS